LGEAGEHILQALLQAEVENVPAAHLSGGDFLHRVSGEPREDLAWLQCVV